MEWENHLERYPIRKSKKTQKFKVKLRQREQKTTSKKANICASTVLSLYFKIRAENFHAAKIKAFWLRFLYRRDQNHYSSNHTRTLLTSPISPQLN